jgi:hypothetical protein
VKKTHQTTALALGCMPSLLQLMDPASNWQMDHYEHRTTPRDSLPNISFTTIMVTGRSNQENPERKGALQHNRFAMELAVGRLPGDKLFLATARCMLGDYPHVVQPEYDYELLGRSNYPSHYWKFSDGKPYFHRLVHGKHEIMPKEGMPTQLWHIAHCKHTPKVACGVCEKSIPIFSAVKGLHGAKGRMLLCLDCRILPVIHEKRELTGFLPD